MAKKVGAIDTETILLIGLAGVALYLFMKPAVPVQPQVIYSPSPYALQQQATAQGNSTAGIIAAGASGASNLLNSISNMFS